MNPPDINGERWLRVLERMRDIRDLVPHEGTFPMTAASLPAVIAVDEELDFLRVVVKYLLLDLESTRRELQDAQDALHRLEG